MYCKCSSTAMFVFLVLLCLFIVSATSLPPQRNETNVAKIIEKGNLNKIEKNETKKDEKEIKISSKSNTSQDSMSSRILNWLYPTPSTTKQAFYRWFFDGIMFAGGFVQYDTVKRQILVTAKQILEQKRKERKERAQKRKNATLYGYGSAYKQQHELDYYYPTQGYELIDSKVSEENDVEEIENSHKRIFREGRTAFSFPDQSSYLSYYAGDNRAKKQSVRREHRHLWDEKKSDIPYPNRKRYLPNSSHERNGNNRRQTLSRNFSRIYYTDIMHRVFGLSKVCFWKSLCELQKLSSVSSKMETLWNEIRRTFSPNDMQEHSAYLNKYRRCDKEFPLCSASSYDLINYLIS